MRHVKRCVNLMDATMKISLSLIHALVFDDDDEFDSRLVSNEIVTNLWGTRIYLSLAECRPNNWILNGMRRIRYSLHITMYYMYGKD